MWWRTIKIKLIKDSVKKMSDVEVLTSYEICVLTLRNIKMLRLLLGKGEQNSKLDRKYVKAEKGVESIKKELRLIVGRRGLEDRLITWEKGGK